ncbi:MAG: CPBP family intramembrane metalloprotease [Planctomycetes bacterium]|nr:CPBP family intramembrane metalloprotease [Planctomycetota bacterium]
MKKVFLDSEGRLRILWRFVVFMLGLVAAYILVGVAAGLFLGLFFGEVPEPQVPWALCVCAVPFALVSLLWVWFCRRRLDRRKLIGLRMQHGALDWITPPLGLVLGCITAAIPVLVLFLAGALRYTGIVQSSVIPFLAVALLPGAFAEEVAVRGYLLQNLDESGHRAIAVIGTSMIFSAFHMLNPAFFANPLPALNTFLAGIVLGLAYLLTGSLWFTTAWHYGWNALQGVVFGLPVSGIQMPGLMHLESAGDRPMVGGGEFGLEGSVISAGILLISAAFFAYAIRVRDSE